MSTHVCVWFEDTWPDHGCTCGARAVLVVEDDGEAVLVALDAVTLDTEVPSRLERLPISA